MVFFTRHRISSIAHLIMGLTIIYCFIHSESQAQTVLISEDINVRSDEVYRIIGESGERIFFFHEGSNKTEIMVYDDKLRYIRTNIIELEKKKTTPFGISLSENDLHYIYYYKDRGDLYMMVRRYSDQLELMSKDTIFISEKADFTPRYYMAESEDLSKVLIYSLEKNTTIQAHCYDLKSFSKIWSKSIQTEGKLREDFAQVIVSNSGVGYFIMDRSPLSLRKQRMNLDIIRYSQGMRDPLSFSIEVNQLNSEETLFTYDNKNGYVVIAGLYAEKTNNRLNGMYLLRVNTLNPEKRVYKKYAFSEELEADIIAESKDKHEGILNLKPVDIVLRDDGGILLLSEIQKIHQRYGGVGAEPVRNPGNRNWTDYFHEDIIMHTFYPDGRQHWNLVLHKKQYSQDDDGSYSSFFLFKNRSAIRLFFNDEISSSNTVSEYIITPDGRSQRKSVMSTEYQKLRLRFSDALQLDGKSFVVPSDNGNKLNLVKIAYN